jgi:alpha-amylase
MVPSPFRFAPALLAVVATLLLTACGADMAPVTTEFKTTNLARDWRGEVVYQLMVDRFADGQRDNNKGVVVGDLGRYQGGDWQGVIDHVDYLKKLGVTSVWISPVRRIGEVVPVPCTLSSGRPFRLMS